MRRGRSMGWRVLACRFILDRLRVLLYNRRTGGYGEGEIWYDYEGEKGAV